MNDYCAEYEAMSVHFSEDENSYSNIFNDLQNLDEIQYDQLSLINLEVNYFEIQH